ncbi:MAG: hypothetical protein WDM87_01165 [Terracidiphilus sp.]
MPPACTILYFIRPNPRFCASFLRSLKVRIESSPTSGSLSALTCSARSHSMKKNTAATFQLSLRGMSSMLCSQEPPRSFRSTATHDAADVAYERVGRLVLEQSDFLIAIWNGEPAAGRGGTAQIVEEALEQNIPVIWLHGSLQQPPCVLLIDESGEAPVTPTGRSRIAFHIALFRRAKPAAT